MWWQGRSAELPLSNLDPNGYNYVIQNVEMSTNRQVITLLPGNQLGVTIWQPRQETAGEKIFKIEHCSDNTEEWILTAYNSEPEIQWVVDNLTLKAQVYPRDESERARPPYNWRFRFEEVGQQGSKKYLITSQDEDLNGNNCLCLVVPQTGTEPDSPETTGRRLGFAARNENDSSQIWYLYQQ